MLRMDLTPNRYDEKANSYVQGKTKSRDPNKGKTRSTREQQNHKLLRKYIVDSGASLHIIARRNLTKKEWKAIRKSSQSYTLKKLLTVPSLQTLRSTFTSKL